MTAPFTDLGDAGVAARVAIAWVKLQRRRRLPAEVKPPILIGVALAELDGLQLVTVRLALLSLSNWVTEGKQSQDWLAGVLMRDYYRLPLRRCFFAAYKANRRR